VARNWPRPTRDQAGHRVGRVRPSWILVLAVGAAACAGESSTDGLGTGDATDLGVEIERFDVDVPISGSTELLGDVLMSEAAEGSAAPAFRSTDLGESWEPVELPDVPDEVERGRLDIVGEGVAFDGWLRIEPRDSELDRGHFYVWTSRDGIEWQGGRLSDSLSGDIGLKVVATDERWVAGFVPEHDDGSEEVELLYSDDGETWEQAEHPGRRAPRGEFLDVERIWQPDGEPLTAKVEVDSHGSFSCQRWQSPDGGVTWQESGSCSDAATEEPCPPAETVGSLCQRGDEVSFDQGSTWQQITIEPPLDTAETPSLHSTVELVGGGWLSMASITEAGDVSYEYLLQSDDGLTWQQVLPEPCHDVDITRPNSELSGPAPLGDRWVVEASCSDLSDLVRSELYLVSADGDDPVELSEHALDDGIYGGPLAIDGAVVVGAYIDGNQEIIRLRPQ